jgi:hypothetical protein
MGKQRLEAFSDAVLAIIITIMVLEMKVPHEVGLAGLRPLIPTRRAMLVPIAHLAEVGRAAAREEHELGKAFRFRPDASTYFAFRTAARGMATAAQEHREVLLKYGLSQSVLDELLKQVDQLDEAIVLGYEGRAAHVGATRELRVVSTEIFRTVRLMDGRSRQRFAEDGQLLGSWISASTVLRKPQPGKEAEEETPGGGEVRPAA